MENIVEKVVDRSIFKNPVKFRVPDTTKCKTCDGSGSIDIKNGPKVICPTCYGSGTSFQGGKKEVEGVVQYVPIAFEEKKKELFNFQSLTTKMINLLTYLFHKRTCWASLKTINFKKMKQRKMNEIYYRY